MQTEIILLAAGKSSRTGTPKGLLAYDKLPWLKQQIEELLALNIGNVNIVLGFHSEKYLPLLRPYGQRITVVTNPNPELGSFSSLIAGIKSLKQPHSVFILPLDVPCPEFTVWQALLNALSEHLVAVPSFDKKGGHPILLSPWFCQSLMNVELNSPGARLDRQVKLLAKEKIARVAVQDKNIAENLNTLADFSRYFQKKPKKILIVGPPGAGKTFLASRVARKLSLPHLEMDKILTLEKKLERLEEESWIVEGHFTKIRSLVEDKAELVVWLDRPRLLCTLRVTLRTIREKLSKQTPHFRKNLKWSEVPPLIAWKIHRSRQKLFATVLDNAKSRGVKCVRLQNKKAIESFLASH